MKYAFVTSVEKVFEHRPILRGFRPTEPGAQPELEYANCGWFIKLAGSYEALYVGEAKPVMVVGDKVKVTIEKVA